MDYINLYQQLACEEISIAKASVLHWKGFTELKIMRSYIADFDSVFLDKFLNVLFEDKKTAESLDLDDSEYYQIFQKYKEMNQSKIYVVGLESMNLIYTDI